MDAKELKEKVERFLGFLRDQLSTIKDIDFKQHSSLFRKLFYVGILDTLSRTASHPKKGNRDRILTFVNHFCDWPNRDKISLPHLVRLLEKVPDPEFSKLREYAFGLFDEWEEGKIITLDRDPDFKIIKALWPSDIPKPLADIQIEFLQHSNLFYRYRNSLVHELREPGYGMEFKEDKEPFYHSMSLIDTDADIRTWELVYPLGFYDTICKAAIANLEQYYLKERIDPYSCYTFGTYWIDELNS